MSGTLSFLAVIVLAFGMALLLSKKGKSRADYLLLLWLGIFGIHLMTINSLDWLPPFGFRLNTACSFLHGPLFFAYVISLANGKELRIPVSVLLSAAFVAGMLVSWFEQPIPFVINALVVALYAYRTAMMLRTREATVLGFTPLMLPWLRFLLSGIIILLIIPLVQLMIDPAGLASSHNLIGTLFYCAFIVVLTFWGVRMAPILVGHSDLPPKKAEAKKPRYQQSGLSPADRQAIYQDLEMLMTAEHLYLDAALSLRSAATRLGVSANHVSEAVNGASGQNFNDYVNSHRVTAVRKRIQSGDHNPLTFLALALECGFNSKASFNRAFSKHTAQTPSKLAKSVSET